jgi:hypothetical protein
VSIRLRRLLLFLPVDDIPNGKDHRVGRELQGLFHLDKLGFSECFRAKGFPDEVGVGFWPRGGDLLFPC